MTEQRPSADVWIVRWADFDEDSLYELLGETERSRAGRITDTSARTRFVLARGLLRQVIGRELNVAPDALRFDHSSTGRPRVRAPSKGMDLRFSVSHADAWGLLGITRGQAIGVDVERLRSDLPVHRLAERFFTRRESTRLRHSPKDRRIEDFIRMWTAKEALIKAHGETVPQALRRYELDVQQDDETVALSRIDGNEDSSQRWQLATRYLDARYVATVALESPDAAINWQHLNRAPRRA